jgi:hypothetical protein
LQALLALRLGQFEMGQLAWQIDLDVGAVPIGTESAASVQEPHVPIDLAPAGMCVYVFFVNPGRLTVTQHLNGMRHTCSHFLARLHDRTRTQIFWDPGHAGKLVGANFEAKGFASQCRCDFVMTRDLDANGKADPSPQPYSDDETGIIWHTKTRRGDDVAIRITNFKVRIISDITRDDVCTK